MERGIQRNDESHAIAHPSGLRYIPDKDLNRSSETHDAHRSIQAHTLLRHNQAFYCSSAGLRLLQRGKHRDGAVDHDQQVDTQDIDNADKKEFLRCTECHYPITRKRDRIQINEQHQHVFANPHGYIFHIGCFAQAPGCVIASEETSYFSWFPGYAWQIALCGQCLTLLGWAFRSSESQFFGLILDKLK